MSPYPNGCPFKCSSGGQHQDYGSLFLPHIEALAGSIIGLPNHPALTQDDIEYVIDAVVHLYE